MPFAGEAVIATHAPVGMNGIWLSTLLRGRSSNVGSASARASDSRAGACEAGRRRNAITGGASETPSDVGVGKCRLSPSDEVAERLVDARVDQWRLVLGEHLLPDPVGALRRVERAVLLPLLEAVVVGYRTPIKGRLEVRERVRGAEEVLTGPVLADGVEALPVLGQVDPTDEGRHHSALVGVEDELLVAAGEPALEPARGVEHEVDPGEDRRDERRGALVRCLSVGNLRCAQRAAAPERDTEPSRQC